MYIISKSADYLISCYFQTNPNLPPCLNLPPPFNDFLRLRPPGLPACHLPGGASMGCGCAGCSKMRSTEMAVAESGLCRGHKGRRRCVF